ncbi:MAG: hypothetical protein ABJH72_01285 [Reichenbachiella sp.]|uniref:toxin-antitoxin system YwqK family antitoxin n=1 Tax=Reichenbachiella sp. TaxID=2184521 RepID=UPI003265AC6B
MKNITAIIIFLASHNVFSQDTTYLSMKWEQTIRSNAEYYRLQRKQDTLWDRRDYYFSNNQLQMSGTFSSLTIPAVKEGYFEWYHKNGQLKHKGTYKSGKEVGEHLWFFDNGNIEAKETYEGGQLNGVWEEYHSNGNKSILTSFKDGFQHGFTQYFRKDGTKHSEGHFVTGEREGEWKYYNSFGELPKTINYKTIFEFQEANLRLRLPNNEWKLSEQSAQSKDEYIFNRSSVLDPEGRAISPAIMLYIDDATAYNGDVTLYSLNKRHTFLERGIKINETYIQSDKQYPLELKNGCFINASYTSGGLEHVLFMVHLITDTNKGIQLYMDMTKNIADKYEEEFWTTLTSIKEL